MCVGLVGTVVAVEGDDLDRIGVVDVGAETRRIGLVMLPDADVGDTVVIHAGYAVAFAP